MPELRRKKHRGAPQRPTSEPAWSNIPKETRTRSEFEMQEEPAEKAGLRVAVSFQAFGGNRWCPSQGLRSLLRGSSAPETRAGNRRTAGHRDCGGTHRGCHGRKSTEKAGVHIAYVSGVEYDSGTAILNQKLDDPSEPLIVWHIEGDDNGASKGG